MAFTYFRRTGQRGNRTLRLFSLQYIVIILIMLIIGVVVYTGCLQIVRNAHVSSNSRMLENTLSQLEQTLSDCNAFVHTLTQNDLLTVFSRQSETPDVASIREVIATLPDFTDGQHLVSRYYIYLKKQNYVLEWKNACTSLKNQYDLLFRYGNWTYDEWHTMMNSSYVGFCPAASVSVNGQTSVCALYMINNIFGSNSHRVAGKTVFYLNEDTVLDFLRRSLPDTVQNLWLFASDELMISSGETLPDSHQNNTYVRFDKEPHLLLEAPSSAGHFRLVISIPSSSINAQMYKVLWPLLIGLLVLLLTGTFFCFFAWRNNRQPLRSVLESLSDDLEGNVGIRQIPASIEKLKTDNRFLSERLEAQQLLLKETAINRLLKGDEKDIEELMSHLKLRFEGSKFAVVLLEICANDDENYLDHLNYQRSVLQELLLPYNENLSFLSLHSESTMILLFHTGNDSSPAQELNDLLGRFYIDIRRVCDFAIKMYVGRIGNDYAFISHSYASACDLMETEHILCSDEWLFERGNPITNKGFLLDKQEEARLVNLTRAGNTQDVLDLLEQIYRANASHSVTSYFGRRLLMSKIVDLLLESGFTGELNQEIVWSLNQLSFKHFFEIVKEHFAECCEQVNSSRTTRTDQMMEKIVTYINQNFENPDMCLTLLSSQFGLGEKRISTVVKEKTGCSFQAYVEKLRIEKANELLLGSNLSIEEIAGRVGYTNDRTFRRAYTKIMGYTPSNHRNAHNGISDEHSKEDIEQ